MSAESANRIFTGGKSIAGHEAQVKSLAHRRQAAKRREEDGGRCLAVLGILAPLREAIKQNGLTQRRKGAKEFDVRVISL